MKPKPLRFRQIHLDFHTSPHIEGIGAAFDKGEWQRTLRAARVDSVTCFSKCHHGLSYHPTKVGTQHPHLGFDLLRAQAEANREIGVKTQVYISAGVDNAITVTHPEWREIDKDGRLSGWNRSPLEPGFHKLCFNTPYLDYLCEQIKEAATLFPEADGIWLDIIFQGQCCCNWCMASMATLGLDPLSEADRLRHVDVVVEKYFRATTAACKIHNPDMPVFHNSGHVARNRRDWVRFNSHLELESLPTGGWGYDHFPESATYSALQGLEFLGMTGKFHLSWGEFGGFKHPNALRYECAAMNALGAKCCVGDQLHPSGRLDESTYALIGEAYREVEEREPWCRAAVPVADIGVLSSESELPPLEPLHGNSQARMIDSGVSRVLLEGQQLFALIDRHVDFSNYKLLILPDNILVDAGLEAKVNAYLAGGGKLILSGVSGLRKTADTTKMAGGYEAVSDVNNPSANTAMAFDIGGTLEGPSPFKPDYMLPAPGLRADWVNTPSVVYQRSQRLKVTTGESLGDIHDPYFNRTYAHFCSHRHTPNRPEPSGYHVGVQKGNIAYFAHPVFGNYRNFGAVADKRFVLNVINRLLGCGRTLETNLTSTARVALARQPQERRQVLHLLYASKMLRGGVMDHAGTPLSAAVEVIEELEPVHNVRLSVLPASSENGAAPAIAKVTLEPQGTAIPHTVKDGRVEIALDQFTCHQMLVLHEA